MIVECSYIQQAPYHYIIQRHFIHSGLWELDVHNHSLNSVNVVAVPPIFAFFISLTKYLLSRCPKSLL